MGGEGGVKTLFALAAWFHATLWHLLLHLHPGFMLRYDIFSCTCTQVSCYAVTSSLALANMFRATLWHLVLHLHPGFMLRYDILSCTCTQVSCYAMTSSLALANVFHARLWGFPVCSCKSFIREIHDCKCLYGLIRRHDVCKILKIRGNVHKVSNLLPVPDPVCSWNALLTASSWLRRDRVRERERRDNIADILLKHTGRSRMRLSTEGFGDTLFWDNPTWSLPTYCMYKYIYTYQWIKAPKMESWYWRINLIYVTWTY